MPAFGRGTCIGRYVILDHLGSGGMGVVYRAFDPELDRQVALKLVRDVSDQAATRLVQEAQALARVSHPNIVGVHDVGRFAGSVFIAMELVEGQTLHAWHRQQHPTWRPTLTALIAAGRGLAAAHAAGLIHRDFKPNNVMVGKDGRIRVLDFGLARVAATTTSGSMTPVDVATGATPSTPDGRAGRGRASPTAPDADAAMETATADLDSDGGASPDASARDRAARSRSSTAIEIPADEALARQAMLHDLEASTVDDDGALPQIMASRIIGTPVYMAPEQRKRGVIDARADQFAFAVAAWELLYGERPFEGADASEYAANAAAHKVRPPPPRRDVPAWVRRPLVRALSPAPGDRFRSMDDLCAALAADPAARRRNVAIGALAVGLAALAVVSAVRRRDPPEPCVDAARHLAGVWDAAAATRIRAAFEATGKRHAADAFTRVRAALDGRAHAWVAMHHDACVASKVRGEQSPALLDLRMGCLDRRLTELQALVTELGEAPDTTRMNRALEAVAALPDVASCADRDALTAVVPMPSDPDRRAQVLALEHEVAELEALTLTGQWRQARARAIAADAAARALDYPPLVAEVAYQRGRIERLASDFDAAEAAQRQAALAAARAHDDALAARAWSELVDIVGYGQARPVEALAFAAAAEAAFERAGAEPRARAELLEGEALTLMVQGHTDEALERARRALAMTEAAVGPDDPDVADVVNTVAMLESSRGDYAAAEALHRRALKIREAAFGPDHPRVGDSLDNLGVVVFHQGRLDEAEALYRRALDVRTAALGDDARDVGTTLNNLGGLEMERGDDAAAAADLERALAIYERTLGHDHADLAIPLSNLGDLAARRGDHARALGYCRRALALDQGAADEGDPDLAYDLDCIGEAHLGLGDAAAARPVLEQALQLREGAPGDAGELARTRFDLARALWQTAAGDGDRKRARQLARAALAGLTGAGGASAARAAEAKAWLATH